MMIISILYVISAIFVFITFFLKKKKDEKISFIKFSIISIISFMSYNTLICFLFRLINIPITLQILMIFNFVFGIIFLVLIIKDKGIQKYSINKKDVIAICVILLIATIMSIMNFGTELHIKYIMTDSALHFSAAREFYETGTLVDNIKNDMVTGSFMAGAYTNTGICFKVFAPFIGEINLYKLFILFDIFIFLFVGLAIYSAVEKIIDSKSKYILSLFMIVFFMLGYPLNSMIYGFVYLQLGILIIITIVNVLQCFNENINKKYLYGILFLLNFGLFFTYCIFTPIVYIVEFIYIIKKEYSENKKIITIKNFMICAVIFVIPIVFGVYYFVLPHLQATRRWGRNIYKFGRIHI